MAELTTLGQAAARVVNRLAPRRITRPGLYFDIPAADYFADPCASPSLTQSLAKLLLERSPRHAWTAHPRLNPAHEPDDPTKFDLGNAAHYHLIGRGKSLAVVDATDWRTKDAKAMRAAALANGKTAVLREQFDRAGDMARAAYQQLAAMGFGYDWAPEPVPNVSGTIPQPPAGGDGEVVIAWHEGDVWLRCMVDWLSKDRRVVWDYKTTRASAAPHALAAKMADDGWCIQAAMHERGLDALDPDGAGRRKHRFVVQECEPPYALSVAEIPEAALTIGRRQLAAAVDIWRRCTAENRWPGYPQQVIQPEYPGWAESRWLERETVEFSGTEFAPSKEIPADILMGG